MSAFDSLWDRASKLLDSTVDNVLGDRLRYRHNGVWLGTGDPAVVEGFVRFFNPLLNTEELDETLGSRKRVKISMDLVDEPIQSDRIQHPKLGPGWFRPAGDAPDNEGRYWLFDVQRASAP